MAPIKLFLIHIFLLKEILNQKLKNEVNLEGFPLPKVRGIFLLNSIFGFQCVTINIED
jgi:hypothetical protein